MPHLHKRVVVLPAILLAAVAAWAQPVLINNVPDWNQPANYAAPVDNFVQPPDPPLGVGGVANWCVPTAAANIMGWFEDVGGHAGLGDGQAFPNPTPPPNTYPNLDTNAGAPDGLADFQQNRWHDGTIEMGYYMDTQDWAPPPDAPPPSHTGTLLGAGVADIPLGLQAYLNAYSSPTLIWRVWQYDIFNAGGGAVATGWQDYLTGGFGPTIPAVAPVPQNGVQLGDVVLVHWDRWLVPGAGPVSVDDPNQITWYDWSGPWTGMGHTVTGVGYAINHDPDGAAGPLPLTDWVICHDTWPNTGNPYFVAVPYMGFGQNPAITFWQGNTHIEYGGQVPEPGTLALLAMGLLALGRRRRRTA